MSIIIEQFTGVDDVRSWIQKPFNIDNDTIATDGAILVAIPVDSKYKDNELDGSQKKTIGILLDGFFERGFTPLSKIKTHKSEPCPRCNQKMFVTVKRCDECESEGYFELKNKFNSYEVECKSCGGEGEYVTPGGDTVCGSCHGTGEYYHYAKRTYIEKLDLHFADRYINLINKLDNVKVSAGENRMFFYNNDMRGILMAIKAKDES